MKPCLHNSAAELVAKHFRMFLRRESEDVISNVITPKIVTARQKITLGKSRELHRIARLCRRQQLVDLP